MPPTQFSQPTLRKQINQSCRKKKEYDLPRACRLSLCVFPCGTHDLGPGPSLSLPLSLHLFLSRAPAVSLCVFSPLWDPRLGTSLFLSLSHAPAVSLCVCVFFSVRPTIWTQGPVSLSLSTWVQGPVSLYLFFSRVTAASLSVFSSLWGPRFGPRTQVPVYFSPSLALLPSLSVCVSSLWAPRLGPRAQSISLPLPLSRKARGPSSN